MGVLLVCMSSCALGFACHIDRGVIHCNEPPMPTCSLMWYGLHTPAPPVLAVMVASGAVVGALFCC